MDKKGQNPRKNSKELGVVLVKPKRPDIGSRLSRKFSGNTSFTSERKSSLNKTQRPEVRKNSNQSEFKFEIIEPSHYLIYHRVTNSRPRYFYFHTRA